jgi:hypothetical protein
VGVRAEDRYDADVTDQGLTAPEAIMDALRQADVELPA